MPSAYISHADCARHEMGADHPECPNRLCAINDRLVATGLLDYMHSYEAALATTEQLCRAHSSGYVQAILDASPSGGYVRVDPDTQMNPFTVQAALRAAGAVVQATDLVMQHTVNTAFCSVRPPGHHAERSAAMGFCFFNNVAVGIHHALAQHGLERVALIDFDVHHGNGSEDIFQNDPRVLMCSIFETGLYPFCGDDSTAANMVNVGLPARSGGAAFREAVLGRWLPALDAFRPQLIYISAGFDAHREDDMGNLGLVDADYAWVTQRIMEVARQYCQGRVISCLEGGYALNALGRSAGAHIKALIGAD